MSFAVIPRYEMLTYAPTRRGDLITGFVKLFVTCTWAVIGFLIWVPLLMRMVAYFVGIVGLSTYQRVDVRQAQRRLDFATSFYARGFRQVQESVQSLDSEEHYDLIPHSEPIDLAHFFKTTVVDFVWAIAFWSFIYFVALKFVPHTNSNMIGGVQ